MKARWASRSASEIRGASGTVRCRRGTSPAALARMSCLPKRGAIATAAPRPDRHRLPPRVRRRAARRAWCGVNCRSHSASRDRRAGSTRRDACAAPAAAYRPAARAGSRPLDPVELGVDEADVERSVVDHQRRIADELQKLVDDLVRTAACRQELGRQPVHRKGFLRHVPFGIDVDVERLPRRHAVEHLDAADFDQAIAAQRIEAGGFGVENDFAHDAQDGRVTQRIRLAAAAS